MEQKVSIGRIVEFFPGTGDSKVPLPNGMQSAPAIVTQVFDAHVNLTVFVVVINNAPVMTAWGVSHKSQAVEGNAYWDWPQKV